MKTRFLGIISVLVLLGQFSIAQERAVGNLAAERKIALVIGNTNYDSSIGRLKNPVNDANDMADALKRLGFTLVGGKAQLDVNKKRMLELIREFGAQIKQGGAGFFYFSGHGVQVNKRNYIIPITDLLVYEDDAESEAVEVDAIAREMEFAENRLNILVLDACRNNNLVKRTKETGKGLAEPARQPEGTFIAFAARDGQTASDGTGRNGLFTQEFLKFLEEPNVRLDDIFTFTRNAVKRFSDGKQIPAIYYSMSGPIILKSSEIAVQSRPQPKASPAGFPVTNPPAVPSANQPSESNLAVLRKKYDVVWIFLEDGLARVKLNGKYGFVNRTGQEIVSPKYEAAGHFTDGMAAVAIHTSVGNKVERKYGYIDITGKEVIPPKYSEAYAFSEGVAFVCMTNKETKCKIVDKTGKESETIGPPFGTVIFSEGLALIKYGKKLRNAKTGFIDKTGRLAFPFKYDDANSFSEGLALVKRRDKAGFIDKTGNEAISVKYREAASFSEGLACVRHEVNGVEKTGFIDKGGKEVIALKYEAALSFSEGLAPVKMNGKWGFIDHTGKEIIPFRYDQAERFSDGLARVGMGMVWTDKAKYGFIDKNGNEVTAIKYGDATNFSEGLARVGMGMWTDKAKYGFIDKNGNEVIAIKYDQATFFSMGLAGVALNGKLGYIDYEGNEYKLTDLQEFLKEFATEFMYSNSFRGW